MSVKIMRLWQLFLIMANEAEENKTEKMLANASAETWIRKKIKWLNSTMMVENGAYTWPVFIFGRLLFFASSWYAHNNNWITTANGMYDSECEKKKRNTRTQTKPKEMNGTEFLLIMEFAFMHGQGANHSQN